MLNKNFADRVLKIRNDKGFSQKKIFEISGINQGFLSEVEQSKALPSGNFFLLFYQSFDVNLNWLLTGDGKPYNDNKSHESDDNLTPGERLKKCRKLLKLTQDELGKKIKSSHSFICSVEKNKFSMGAEFLYELNRQLNVNINWLLAGDGPMFLNVERPVTATIPLPDSDDADHQDISKPELTSDEILALKAMLTKPHMKSIVIMADNMSDQERNNLFAYIEEQKRRSDLKRGSVPDDEEMPDKRRA